MKAFTHWLLIGALTVPLTLVSELTATAAPAQVVLIRHGEKPDEGNELNAKGWQRANALPQFFNNNAVVKAFGLPVAIYAMEPSDDDGSVRAIQTVTPLAKSLGLEIQSKYSKKEIKPLVDEILSNASYDNHMVLICWEHKMIPKIVRQFGWDNAPDWDGSVFDRAWVLNFTGNAVTQFQNIPQHLLPGDSD